MKKRNTTIFAFLLLAAVGMGVGYAALTDNLTLNGTVGANKTVADTQWDEDIYFSAASIKSQTDGSVATLTHNIGTNTDALILDLSGMTLKGETVVIQVTVKNDNVDYDANLITTTAFTSTTAAADDFTISSTFNDTIDIEASNSYTFEISVTLEVQPTQDLSATFKLEFDAEAIDPVTRA